MAGFAGLVALAVYVATLCPTLPPGDSGDLITAATTLGIAHPPGYPLFSILGHLFTLIPLGSPAFRVNLMSAVTDAVAVAVLAMLVYRMSLGPLAHRRQPIPAAIAAVTASLFLAFATQFWMYSLVAEVFALNNLFAALLLLLAYAWYEDPRRRWAVRAVFFFSGLAFCNQQTIVLLAPGLAAFLIGGLARIRAGGERWATFALRESGIGFALVLAGLLPYLYLPVAALFQPNTMWGDPSTIQRFVALVTRSDYGSFALVAGGLHGNVGDNMVAFASYVGTSFGPVGVCLAAAGLWRLARRAPIVLAGLALSFISAGPLFLAYANPPLGGLASGVFARFYILPAVPFAAIIGCGALQALAWVMDVLAAAVPMRRRLQVAASAVMAVFFVLGFGAPAVARYPAVDQSANRMTLNFVEDLLAPLQQNAILLAEGDTAILGTWYAQNVERIRPDVTVLAVPLLGSQWYIDGIRRQHPDVAIPFDAADVVGKPITGKILSANFAKRPMYYVGVISEAFPTGYGELRAGFARQFVLSADASDPFRFAREHLTLLASLHYPTRTYPDTTWENNEITFYTQVAFDIANAYETVDVAQAEAWYRRAIVLGPHNSGSYKNLAILLDQNGGSPSEIADLLDRYLQLVPADPDAGTIRASILRLRGTTAP